MDLRGWEGGECSTEKDYHPHWDSAPRDEPAAFSEALQDSARQDSARQVLSACWMDAATGLLWAGHKGFRSYLF